MQLEAMLSTLIFHCCMCVCVCVCVCVCAFFVQASARTWLYNILETFKVAVWVDPMNRVNTHTDLHINTHSHTNNSIMCIVIL